MMTKRKNSVNRLWKYMVGTIGLGIGGAVLAYHKLPRIPLSKYKKVCLYLAILDDEICRNELEGNYVGDREIVFPPKRESLQYRYHLFLETYKRLSLKELEEEVSQFEKRLEESRAYSHEKNKVLQVKYPKNNG